MDHPETRSEILAQLGRHRRNILAGLKFYDGQANSRDLREFADVPKGSMRHHLQTLVEWEVIRETGLREHAGSGPKASVYELTKKGDSVIEELPERQLTPRDAGQLRDRIETLEREFDDVHETVDTILDYLEQIAEE